MLNSAEPMGPEFLLLSLSHGANTVFIVVNHGAKTFFLHLQHGALTFSKLGFSLAPVPCYKVIQPLSGSYKPRIIFFLFLNVKMPTIVGILTFMSRKSFTS